MDAGRATEADIGALDHVGQLVLGHTDPGAADQRGHAGVAQRRADAQPCDLLIRFVDAQCDVFAIEADHLKLGFELLPARPAEESDHADTLAAAPIKLLDRQANASFLAPAHIDAAREETRLRHVIVILDIHGHLLARPENEQCLDGARPARDPAGGVADVLRADDEDVIHSGGVHQTRERGMPAGVFRIREARIVLFENRTQLRRQPQCVGRRHALRRFGSLRFNHAASSCRPSSLARLSMEENGGKAQPADLRRKLRSDYAASGAMMALARIAPSRSRSSGLGRKSSMPAAMQAERSSSNALAVSAMIGVREWRLVLSAARMRRVASRPSLPGMCRSISTRL